MTVVGKHFSSRMVHGVDALFLVAHLNLLVFNTWNALGGCVRHAVLPWIGALGWCTWYGRTNFACLCQGAFAGLVTVVG